MLSFAAASLAGTMMVSGYLTIKCVTPPNKQASTTWKQDRVQFIYSPPFITVAQFLPLAFVLYHAYMVAALDGGMVSSTVRSWLNDDLFHWGITSTACLFFIICVGAPLRLAAYGSLGKSFTFNLAPPNELNTGGIYRFIQHPSYTGLLFVAIPNLLLFGRWDAAAGLLIPTSIRQDLSGFGLATYAAILAMAAYFLWLRIRDEEAMLKEVFGKKWVIWNKSTSRLIPGVF